MSIFVEREQNADIFKDALELCEHVGLPMDECFMALEVTNNGRKVDLVFENDAEQVGPGVTLEIHTGDFYFNVSKNAT